MITSLLTILLAGLVVLIGLAIVAAVLGLVVGIVGFLLFKVAPIVLIGYVIVRFLRPREKRLADVEQRWLRGD